VDLRNVHLGQKAEMHLDAYPGLSLPAELEQASPLGHQGQFSQLVRTFAMQFAVARNGSAAFAGFVGGT